MNTFDISFKEHRKKNVGGKKTTKIQAILEINESNGNRRKEGPLNKGEGVKWG